MEGSRQSLIVERTRRYATNMNGMLCAIGPMSIAWTRGLVWGGVALALSFVACGACWWRRRRAAKCVRAHTRAGGEACMGIFDGMRFCLIRRD